MTRPEPPPAPDGYRFEPDPEPETRWRIPRIIKQCRAFDHTLGVRVRCRRRGAIETNRSSRGGQNWWAYCPDHAYGRWIENGHIMYWRLVAVTDHV